jgi:hypothetical protein
MNWNDAAPAAIIGAVVATVGVFLIELAVKPAFACKRVAKLLLIEIRLNVRLLYRAREHREQQQNDELLSESIFMSQRHWDAVQADLHHLPEHALRPLLLTYNQFTEINKSAESHSRKADMLLQMDEGPRMHALMQEYRDEGRLFGESLAGTLDQCERTMVHLRQLVQEGPPMLDDSFGQNSGA